MNVGRVPQSALCVVSLHMAIVCSDLVAVDGVKQLEQTPGLLAFWDFQDGGDTGFVSRGRYQYALTEQNGPVQRVGDGVFGNQSLDFQPGQWLLLQHVDESGLNLRDTEEFSMIAWVQRQTDRRNQYVAGVWDELNHQRQYGLVLSGEWQTSWRNDQRSRANHVAMGYVSTGSGVTIRDPDAFGCAAGRTALQPDRWTMIGFSYDGEWIRVYVDGELDRHGDYNPFKFEGRVLAGTGEFTVAGHASVAGLSSADGATFPKAQPTKNIGFDGRLAGLAVFDRVLAPDQFKSIHQATRQTNPPPVPDWIRGEGDRLEMRLRGRVLTLDGKPAKGATATLDLPSGEVSLQINEGSFETWLPAGRLSHSTRISAVSVDGGSRGSRSIARYELRSACRQGITLSLQPTSKTIKVRVVDDRGLVTDARCKASLSSGREIQGRRLADGTFAFDLLTDDELLSLTAWTDDQRLGGFQFGRTPVRDPNANKQTIKLAKCRNQRVLAIDINGQRVPGLEMTLQVATPPPDFNYLGVIKASKVTTDADGTATFRYFPDWEKVHRYVDLGHDSPFVLDDFRRDDDGNLVVQVKRRAARRTLTGNLSANDASAAGYLVCLRSFQAEQKNHSDHVDVYSNLDGSFQADVLVGSTYAIFVNDVEMISGMIDVLPFENADSRAQQVELGLRTGALVEMQVTMGRENLPMAGATVSVRQTHNYTWLEDGKTQSGSSARDWWVTTDHRGRALFQAEPGKGLSASIFDPDWRGSESIKVQTDTPNLIKIHRASVANRTVLGQISLADGVEGDVDDVKITIGSLDGETRGEQTIRPTEQGIFSARTRANRVAVLAITDDQTAAVAAEIENLGHPILLTLQPTVTVKGQLLNQDDQPIAGMFVRSNVRIKSSEKSTTDALNIVTPSPTFFAKQVEVTTDHDGRYEITGVPIGVELDLSFRRTDDSDSLMRKVFRVKQNFVERVDQLDLSHR